MAVKFFFTRSNYPVNSVTLENNYNNTQAENKKSRTVEDERQ